MTSLLATGAYADPLDNWQVQHLATDILTGATYGNGLYVIVGQTNGKIWTSTDTVTWTDRTRNTSDLSNDVTFANGVFVAGGRYYNPPYGNPILASTDGINWMPVGSDGYGNPLSVRFLNNVFYAPDSGTDILTSTDGVSWGGGNNRYVPPAVSLEDIAFGKGMYVLAIGTPIGTPPAAPGVPGNIWSNSYPPSSGLPGPTNGYDPAYRASGTSAPLRGVAYGNSTFVAVGDGGTIITSPDGINWTVRTSGTTNILNAIAFGAGVFATAGGGGTILTSPDGVNWTTRASGTTNLLRGIAFANSRFMAVGVSGTVTISGGTSSSLGVVGNISTRSFVQTNDNAMIGGVIIQDGNKKIMVRAIGPSLSAFGISNPLADPTLELRDSSGALLATNDDWQTTIIGGIITTSQVGDIQNSGLAPINPKESALITTLAPGAYTAIVRGVNGTGIGVIEIYGLQ
jgi:hypothetical protein